ncbi:UvrD-helicase domain-containing protein [Rhizobium paknamense]|uniref:DNA 3'-5' helicase n=2 Tax=Rhizobium/Agrobacterium group TaxID=227290 RepID=A0ABU0IJA2_9HYPH|nr:UvrD-helicase domain-containing protein [Rhizobium paknamense]MDQ0457505.1 superfamily I DNA/RNA helicase [Rhizobium paknamense]
MDAVELARQRAQELNRAAVQAGVDAWSPYALIQHEAARRGIEIDRVAKGSSVLNGARALYDPSLPLIIHEETGSVFEDAFLVAHELGHVELGDATLRDEVISIDPARAAEMPPIGAERVEDYSRRQRREVQMDLFAREFLFPRTLAREAHIYEKATADEIAERLGASKAVVAQQMLDALLLPEPVIEAEELRVSRPLNKRQKEAAEHWGPAYLLEAGPGTGKTQTLVGRILWLLDKGIDPRGILVLTFSNKAAGELFDRVAQVNPTAAAAIWIGTFHAFGLDIIRRHHDRLGLPDDPKMIDKADAIELLEDEAPRLNLVQFRNISDPTENLDKILAAISRAKDELASPADFDGLAQAMKLAASTPDEEKEAERQIEVASVYRRYEELKAGLKRLDFGDLVTLPIQLFNENEDVRAAIASTYEHVLVDEYQDVNRSSVALLKKLKPGGTNLWVVGDIKQSIYRFRGASSINMAKFATGDFPGASIGRLEVNYRSTEEIVSAFSNFAVNMNVAQGRDSSLEAHRGSSGCPPEHRLTVSAENETEAVADAISEMQNLGISYRDQAVLCTGNDRLAKIGSALETLNIPVLYLGSIFEREEVKDLLSFLSLLVDRKPMGLVRLATMDDFAMSLEDVGVILDAVSKGKGPSPIWTFGEQDLPDLSFDGRNALAKAARALSGLHEASQPWEVLVSLLLDRTRIAAAIAETATISSRARGIAIWQLLNFCRTQPSGKGLPIRRLLDRVRRLVRLADDRDLRQLPNAAQGLDAVRLMTVHGSKGLEFRAVHFPGISTDSIPRSPNHFQGIESPDGLVKEVPGKAAAVRSAAHLDEQECLFYVALSRARDRLFLYSPTKKANGHSWSVSPFVARLIPPMVQLPKNPTVRLPTKSEEVIDLHFDGTPTFKDTQLAIYEKCPRRFLYTYVLQTGGRRVESTFMKMHDAVQDVVDWITSSDPAAVVISEASGRLQAAMTAHGLDESGYVDDYLAIAQGLISNLLDSRQGHSLKDNDGLSISAGTIKVAVRVDELLQTGDGRIVARRIRTGHGTKASQSDLAASSFFMAVRDAFPNATVELMNLADAVPIRLEFDKLASRRQKIGEVVGGVASGRFPAKPSNRTCHRCPAFFICGPVPPGPLSKKSD